LSRVRLVPHDSSWAAEFEREVAVVRACLGPIVACVHHIGSTAIPGIHAKPIIDMLVEVTDLDRVDGRSDAMAAAAYEPKDTNGREACSDILKKSAGGVRLM
jgi:GrpB-like predicted nucleotidyltransferase (UPF0157 family)